MKERINNINEMAQENWEKAQGMLDMLNDIYGTKFGWLNKRVVIFADPEKKYSGGCYDAWVHAQ